MIGREVLKCYHEDMKVNNSWYQSSNSCQLWAGISCVCSRVSYRSERSHVALFLLTKWIDSVEGPDIVNIVYQLMTSQWSSEL